MDLTEATWRTSTRSSAQGNCVEVADNLPGVVAVRDSKDRQGPALAFTPEAWSAFLTVAGTQATR
ncbi:DUF397 domain-containing protein [Micromonospora sp. WMMD1128]|uniref:DUF397 domain-containing protein n=1 Tax=Micromonospora sp. WMMD1128 TaxID=3015150 RepID=UPI00248C38D9|nr:DUF397 domain-containing protein [Micromonospora sp. WMMD1128]WBB77087.1 DUF397 domain-containing protein [Micromonospora sp. WMMD1128]